MTWLYYIVVFVMPFQAYGLVNFDLGPTTFIKALGAALFVLALVRALFRGVPPVWRSLTAKALLLFIAWRIVSWFLGENVDVAEGMWSPSSLRAISSSVAALLFLFISAVVVDTQERLRRTVVVCTASLGLAGLHIIREWVGGSARPGWVFGDANYYAVYALVALPIAYTLQTTETKPLLRWGAAGSVLLTLFGLLLSGSRAGFITLMVFALVQLLWGKKQGQKLLLVCVLLVSLYAVPKALQRLLNPTYSDLGSNYLHMQYAQAALEAMWEHPLLGVGPGAAYFVVPMEGRAQMGVAHNTFLEVGAESGIPALVIYLLVIFSAWWSLRTSAKAFAQTDNRFLAELSRKLQFSLLGFLLMGMTVSASFVRITWFVFILAILLSRQRLRQRAGHAAAQTVVWSPSLPRAATQAPPY